MSKEITRKIFDDLVAIPALKERRTYSEIRNGFLVTLDAETGEEVGLTKPGKALSEIMHEDGKYVEVPHPRDPSKVLLIDRSINLDDAGNYIKGNAKQAYSQLMADMICDYIMNGHSLKSLCKQPGMPSYSTIKHWRALQPGFQEQYDTACAMRAELEIDENVEIARDTMVNLSVAENEVAAAKLLIEQKRFRAQSDNKKYSTQKGESGSGATLVQINVTTGVGISDYAQQVSERTISETGMVINGKKPEG